MNINKKELKTILEEVSKDFQRQNQVLYEQFEYDLKIIGEDGKIIDEKVDQLGIKLVLMAKTLNSTFEEVSNLKVNRGFKIPLQKKLAVI